MSSQKNINTEETDEKIKALKHRFNLETADGKGDIIQKLENILNDVFREYRDGEKTDNLNAWKTLQSKEIINKFLQETVLKKLTETGRSRNEAERLILDLQARFYGSIKESPYYNGKAVFSLFLQHLHDTSSKDGFTSRLLPASSKKGVLFPPCTLSIIAGRPSAGKTTALISLLMEAIRQGRKAVYITTEETPDQLILRMIKNEFCHTCLNGSGGDLASLKSEFSEAYINDVFKDIIRQESTKLFKDTQGKAGFRALVIKAAETIKQHIEAGNISLFDTDRAETFTELETCLKAPPPKTIVFLDYLQNLPFTPIQKNEPPNIRIDRIEQIRRQTYAINSLAKQNNLIIIAGTQFNREAAGETYADKAAGLELNRIGDSGEIERKTHIAIGLGRRIDPETEKAEYFYRVMKDREGQTSTYYRILDYYAYSYLQAETGDGGELVKYDIKNGSTGGGRSAAAAKTDRQRKQAESTQDEKNFYK